jgi:glycosyltransferase involved in cell wall biosynthesis
MKSVAIISSQAYSLINFRGALIRDLVGSGVQVFALAPDIDYEMWQALEEIGAKPVHITLSRVGLNPVRDLWDTISLSRLIRRLRPDVTLTYLIKPVIFGTVAAYLAGVRRRIAMIEGLGYVYTASEGGLTWRRKTLRYVVSFLYKSALSLADRVIFLNHDDIREFVGARLVASGKVIHIDGIGVDLNYWEEHPACLDPVTFVLVARLLREKGVVEFVEAARTVKARYPAVRFVLLGNVDLNPSSMAREEVQAWVDEGVVEWPGHVDVKPWLNRSSVFVLPSYREGLPRSTQEAMAVGRAVITTDVPGCRETVVDGVNGYLIDAKSSNQIAGAMTKFVDCPSKILEMGRESRKIAESRFDVSRINKQIIEILRGTVQVNLD